MGLGQGVTGADAVTGQGTLDVLRYGHILQARQLVSVRGAGLSYDGFYYVTASPTTSSAASTSRASSWPATALVSLSPVVPA